MCTIYLKYDNRNVFAGGASLISDNMLLTLASGVKRFIDNDDSCSNNNLDHELFVVCGSVNLQSDSGAYQERRRVSRILLHPDYNFKTLIFDMAILILEKPFIFTDSIGPVCLPEPSQETEVCMMKWIMKDRKYLFCVAGVIQVCGGRSWEGV